MPKAILKPIVVCLAISALTAATAVDAQSGGGGRHRGGGGGGGGNDGGGHSSSGASTATQAALDKPADQFEIIGVVRSIDPQVGRITIDYEAVDALGWPRGSMPFPVAKPALLKGVTVGEKVRFKIESHQISELKPF